MAQRSSTSRAPRDNGSLAALFGMDFFPAEGNVGGAGLDLLFRTAQRIVEHSGIATRIEQ